MAGTTRWGDDLPPDLLTLIRRRLPGQLDRASLRAVCRAWRHLPTAPPLLCFNNDMFQSLADDEPPQPRFPPPAERLYGCYDDWLLYSDLFEARSPPTCSLSNPLSGITIAKIPIYHYSNGYAWPMVVVFPMSKVIVCSLDLIAALLCSGTVVFCGPGDPRWSVSRSSDPDSRNADIALYRGKIYAVNSSDDIFVHELIGGGESKTSLSVGKYVFMEQPPKAASSSENEDSMCLRWLAVCRGKLLMVRWSVPEAMVRTEEVKLRVFEADLEMGRWLEVDDLGDHALFIGTGCSKAIRITGDDQRVQGNRVYFLGFDFARCCHWLDYRDSPTYGYYDLKNGTISQIFLPGMWNVWPQHSMEWFFPCE